MAEIEFSALSKQCLNRRIPDLTLRREVLAWAHKRNIKHKTVDWKFSQIDARVKLERHYNYVNSIGNN